MIDFFSEIEIALMKFNIEWREGVIKTNKQTNESGLQDP